MGNVKQGVKNLKETGDVINLFYELESIQGTNNKKDFLNENAGNKLFIRTLIWLLDKDHVTGIGAKKLDGAVVDGGEIIVSLEGMMDYIDNHNTGRDEDVSSILRFANLFNPKVREGIIRLAQKKWDKGLGVGRTQVNNVFGDQTVRKFEVMLANKYFDDPEYWTGKTFGVQTKLDGTRTVIVKDNGIVTVYARSGKNLTGKFPTIEADVKAIPEDNFILDGERMPVGFKNLSSTESYKLVSNAKKDNSQNTDYCIAVYDWMPLADWNSQDCKIPYSKRYEKYQKILTKAPGVQKYQHLYALELVYIGKDSQAIIDNLNAARENKQEGVMVKDMDGLYKWDRCNAIVKVKVFNETDLKIIGFEEGKGRHRGRLGAILCEYKGNTVKCGTGFSDELRDEFWKNRKFYLGKTAEIIYFEETQNKSGEFSLRFPVYKSTKEVERDF